MTEVGARDHAQLVTYAYRAGLGSRTTCSRSIYCGCSRTKIPVNYVQ
jgi:hypothetical protein